MELNTKNKIIIGSVIILLLAGLYVSFDRRSKKAHTLPPTPQDLVTSTTTTIGGVKIDTTGTGNYSIKQVPVDAGLPPKIPVPDLNRPVTFSSSFGFTDDVKAIITKKIVDLQAQLKIKPNFLAGWIDLGMYQKMTGDYDGTISSWKYVSQVSPHDFISLGNLGNLYAYYIHDNAQAEIYYKQAIARDPTQVYLYIQLASVYKDAFKDLDKARDIVNQGLSKIPNNPDLLHFQSILQ